MAKIPSMVTPAFVCLDNGERRPAGTVDLTPAIAETLVRQPALLDTWLAGERPLVQHIASSLPNDVHDAAWSGDLALPDFHKDLAAFAEALGGSWRLADLARSMKKLTDLSWGLQRAEQDLKTIAAARWEPNPRLFEMLYGDWVPDDYVSGPDDATDSWGWDEYNRTDPRPDGDWDSPEYKAWLARYEAWKRVECPPYLFGTSPTTWGGVDPVEIRSDIADQEITEVRKAYGVVDNLLENGLDDHHDDARDHVKDEEELFNIVADWLPHAGTGTPDDRALEEKVAAWNAKQAVISFGADEMVAVPAFPDATHAEAIAYCERQVNRARAALETARDDWEAKPPLMAYADRLEPFYARLALSSLLCVDTWPTAGGGLTVRAVVNGHMPFEIEIAERDLGMAWVDGRLAGEPGVRIVHHDEPRTAPVSAPTPR